jgi:hypothetical protein
MDLFNDARPIFNERTVLAGIYSDNCSRYANYGSENCHGTVQIIRAQVQK